jgi:polysaccharide export outer membrane protein
MKFAFPARLAVAVGLFGAAYTVPSAHAQQVSPSSATTASPAGADAAVPALPQGYVIGPEDVLSVVFWRDKDLSADVVVRPDGKISLPLVNDIQAAGLTPEELRSRVVAAASKYVEGPNATVVVKEIHSRKVFITGLVGRPGAFPLTTGMDVLQLIAIAGGLQEFADAKNIVVVRKEQGQPKYLKFNYREVIEDQNSRQNVQLQPGDTIVVP